jgi:hypothetical protein
MGSEVNAGRARSMTHSMTKLRLGWLVLGAAVGLTVGCTKYATYGYQYRMQQQFGGGEEPEPAPVEARELLAAAKTIAFFPPDACVNVDTAAGDTKIKQLRANCGVLMSTLERAAERAGYEVVSWQNLRGNKRPIDFAREASVDVLFEINEFDLGEINDSQVQRTLSFFERGPGGPDSPLSVAMPIAQQCAEYAKQADPVRAAALDGTIDIKTVSVSDGRARWRYRKTLSQSLGRSYPRVTFSAPEQPNTTAKVLFGAGAVVIGLGGGLALAEAATTDDPSTPESEKFNSGGWSTNLLVAGAVAVGVAAVIQIAAGGSKPAPESVLCNGPFATPAVAAPAPTGAMAAEHTFNETTGGDLLVKERERIRDLMIAQFIEILKEVRSHRPAPLAASPPPASPPPASPAP